MSDNEAGQGDPSPIPRRAGSFCWHDFHPHCCFCSPGLCPTTRDAQTLLVFSYQYRSPAGQDVGRAVASRGTRTMENAESQPFTPTNGNFKSLFIFLAKIISLGAKKFIELLHRNYTFFINSANQDLALRPCGHLELLHLSLHIRLEPPPLLLPEGPDPALPHLAFKPHPPHPEPISPIPENTFSTPVSN